MTFNIGVDKVIKQLTKKNPNSRTYNTFLHRLEKKLERLKRYARARASDKTIEIIEEMDNQEPGYEATIPTDLMKAMKV